MFVCPKNLDPSYGNTRPSKRDTPGASKKVATWHPMTSQGFLGCLCFFPFLRNWISASSHPWPWNVHKNLHRLSMLAPSMDRWNSGPARICWRQTNPGKNISFFFTETWRTNSLLKSHGCLFDRGAMVCSKWRFGPPEIACATLRILGMSCQNHLF